MKKLLPPTLFFMCIAAMVVLRWLFPIKVILSFPTTLIGIAPLIAGLGISIIGSRKFTKVGTNIKTFDDPDVLVKDGLFSFTRNPMYLGFVIALLGISILLGNASSLGIVILFFVITDRWYIEFEEQAMTKKFGEEYAVYKSQTRRWI